MEDAKNIRKSALNLYFFTASDDAEQHWNLTAETDRKLAYENRLKRFPDNLFEGLSPSQAFVKWYVRRDPQAWYDYQFDSSFLWEGIDLNMKLFDYLYGVYLKDIDITQGLDSFKKPVLLIVGQYDYIISSLQPWLVIKEKFHHFTLEVFKKSGHSPQYEEPVLFESTLKSWLSKNVF